MTLDKLNKIVNIFFIITIVFVIFYIGVSIAFPLFFSKNSNGKIMGKDFEYDNNIENALYSCLDIYIEAYLSSDGKDFSSVDKMLPLALRKNNDMYLNVYQKLNSNTNNDILIEKIERIFDTIYKVDYIFSDKYNEVIIINVNINNKTFDILYDSLIDENLEENYE